MPGRPSAHGEASAATGASPRTLELSFDDNRLASNLFGQFDQNLALIEKRLGLEAVARGNSVLLKGYEGALEHAERVLESLYDRLLAGHEIGPGDVEGAIRTLRAPPSTPETEDGTAARRRPSEIVTRRKSVVARTPTQDAYIKAMQTCELVFGAGPAGTGKTYLAVAFAAAQLERGAVERLILSRPAVEAGERLGFLPGDMKDKVDPYLRPLYDALYDMMPPDRIERGLASGMIEIAPLAFMRGRTLANAMIILDEAQNATTMQMKMFLTRLGENAKMVVTGDPSQIDLRPGETSGLVEALGLLANVEGVETVRFSGADVVRHPLVARIVAAYDRRDRGSDLSSRLPGDEEAGH